MDIRIFLFQILKTLSVRVLNPFPEYPGRGHFSFHRLSLSLKPMDCGFHNLSQMTEILCLGLHVAQASVRYGICKALLLQQGLSKSLVKLDHT